MRFAACSTTSSTARRRSADATRSVLRRVLRGLPTCRPSSTSRRCSVVFQEYELPRGQADLARPHGRPGGDPAHRAADGRRRARRHLLARPDAGRARPVHRTCGPTCRTHYVQAGVGHYGVFSGRRWSTDLSGGARHDPRVALKRSCRAAHTLASGRRHRAAVNGLSCAVIGLRSAARAGLSRRWRQLVHTLRRISSCTLVIDLGWSPLPSSWSSQPPGPRARARRRAPNARRSASATASTTS